MRTSVALALICSMASFSRSAGTRTVIVAWLAGMLSSPKKLWYMLRLTTNPPMLSAMLRMASADSAGSVTTTVILPFWMTMRSLLVARRAISPDLSSPSTMGGAAAGASSG